MFDKLKLTEPLLKAVESLGFTEPSPIQKEAIPLVMEGKDIIAGAATGSGKTLAFGAGIIERAVKGDGIQAIVLVPTRELAVQVCKSLESFSKFKSLRITPIYGGVSINPQMDALRKAEVVVGTPGRVLDHLERRTINLSKVNMLVLDEADRMLDMGFIDDVRRIASQCPKERQTLLFSATIEKEIENLSKEYMHNPVKVAVESYVDPSKLKQVYYDIPDNMKISVLVHLIKQERSGLVMVFCNTQRNTDFVAKNLKLNGVTAHAIHGRFSQAKRNLTMEKFHAHKVDVLVCTDLAARGLDIPFVSHVYNYDAPNDPKQYIHRIGRTARAGKEGIAINLVSSRDHENYSNVLRHYALDIEKIEKPYVERITIAKNDEREGGRSQGGRGGPRQRFGQRGRREGGRGERTFSRSSERPRENSSSRSQGPRNTYKTPQFGSASTRSK